jgi:hypothetical protein
VRRARRLDEGYAAMAKNIETYEGRVLSHAANGDVSFSEWESSAVIKGMGAMHIKQVAVRRWRNGRVVHERFHHE